jgi:hypothetical protein
MFKNDCGIVFIAALMCLMLLTLLSATAYLLSTTDVLVSTNYKHTEQAFNNAEAGVEFAEALIEKSLRSGAYLPENIHDILDIPNSGDVPSEFSFELSKMEKIGTNQYQFTSTGKASRGATAEIKAVFRQKSVYDYAIFARDKLDLKNRTGIFSYNSAYASGRVPGDSTWDTADTDDSDGDGVSNDDEALSTHHARIGSNGDADGDDIILNNNCFVDGDVLLGQSGDPPTEAAAKDLGGKISGVKENLGYEEDQDPENIGADPEWVNKFPSYDEAGESLNSSAGIAEIADYVIEPADFTVANGKHITISTPGNYYFTQIHLENGDTLTIDTTAGAITIWVVGVVTGDNNSEIDIRTPTGETFTLNVTEPVSGCSCSTIIEFKNDGNFAFNSDPNDVVIRTDSNRTVSIHNENDSKALIYAPYADVDFENGTSFFGAVRGRTVTLGNSMKVYCNEGIKNGHRTNEIEFTSWRQALN